MPERMADKPLFKPTLTPARRALFRRLLPFLKPIKVSKSMIPKGPTDQWKDAQH